MNYSYLWNFCIAINGVSAGRIPMVVDELTQGIS